MTHVKKFPIFESTEGGTLIQATFDFNNAELRKVIAVTLPFRCHFFGRLFTRTEERKT